MRPPAPPDAPPRPARVELWAYGLDYRSANPAAPALPDALREDLADGAELSGSPYATPEGEGYQVAVRLAWEESPCAIVLVRRDGPAGRRGAEELFWGAALLCAVLLVAVLLAAGPIVRRIRRLTADVRASAAGRYAIPVEVSGRDEIAALGRAFNDAGAELRGYVESLEQRERTLRAFVANTTHDVMLPLAVLQGHLSALRKHVDRGDAPESETVRAALEEAHYLGSLVHNLSAVAKLEAGPDAVQHHPVDLSALIERVVARHATMADARGVEMNHAVPEVPPRVVGDVTLIEQAVSNLVHNAVRYNEEGGHVAVVLEVRGERFTPRVVDDGPGIPPEELERLPERRFRGQAARTRHPDGLGIGLSIVRDVAARHGFTLALRASQAGGLEAELAGPLLA